MAARLQLKLGLVAEHDRLADSPDTLVVVEPSVGSVARSKGHLYLLVTSRVSSRHALEATRLAAETIRNEYYYDESAGIRVCLQKAIATANKRLVHQADRLGLKSPDGNGPIGVGVAVVRGNEMYVATVGPAEAYLIRQARLSTLPDPHRERGLPSSGLEPDVWRGEISVGDSLVLVSPNIVARLGAGRAQGRDADAPPAVGDGAPPPPLRGGRRVRLGRRDRLRGDRGRARRRRARTLVPVRPAEPLAGAPDRSPIPLADNVQAAGGRGHGRGRQRPGRPPAARSSGSSAGVQDLMPRRKPGLPPGHAARLAPRDPAPGRGRRARPDHRRRRPRPGGLRVRRRPASSRPISSVNAGQAALDKAQANLAEVSGPGIDLVEDDPGEALDLLTEAYAELDKAEAAKVSARVDRPAAGRGRGRPRPAVRGRAGRVEPTLFTFTPGGGRRAVRPDGAWSAGRTTRRTSSTRTTKTVYRVDLKRQARRPPSSRAGREGRRHEGRRAAVPRGRRPRPAHPRRQERPVALAAVRRRGQGHARPRSPSTAPPSGATTSRAIGTFLADAERGLYNLYVIDPSEQQIRAYPPAGDGSGFPAKPTGWLATARAVDKMTLDVHRRRHLHRRGRRRSSGSRRGKNDGWEPGSPEDDLLRAASDLRRSSPAPATSATGAVYALDRRTRGSSPSTRRAATTSAQYRLAGGRPDWEDLRGLYVLPGVEEAPATARLAVGDGRPPGRPRAPCPTTRRRRRRATPGAERRAEPRGRRSRPTKP